MNVTRRPHEWKAWSVLPQTLDCKHFVQKCHDLITSAVQSGDLHRSDMFTNLVVTYEDANRLRLLFPSLRAMDAFEARQLVQLTVDTLTSVDKNGVLTSNKIMRIRVGTPSLILFEVISVLLATEGVNPNFKRFPKEFQLALVVNTHLTKELHSQARLLTKSVANVVSGAALVLFVIVRFVSPSLEALQADTLSVLAAWFFFQCLCSELFPVKPQDLQHWTGIIGKKAKDWAASGYEAPENASDPARDIVRNLPDVVPVEPIRLWSPRSLTFALVGLVVLLGARETQPTDVCYFQLSDVLDLLAGDIQMLVGWIFDRHFFISLGRFLLILGFGEMCFRSFGRTW